ncbi:glycosyltransferase family 2 protein [bacterium]|nr:glycosyltransferase family 2 protein [bacterium]
MIEKVEGAPLEIQLLIPNEERQESTTPDISIVIPALNEQITIGEFIDWCWSGIKSAGVHGEIIIVDSSTDDTPNIALSKGARVLRTPKRGLGQAYLDAIPYIRGRFIIMGDCDLTYDFRELKPFVDAYRSGSEFVMGSRFKGSIENGAMPALHRYFGTPLTIWILNMIYHSDFSDIHCGMRGLTVDALNKIDLTSKGWEYASEMVLKASRLGFKISEVPVKFYKDREGRMSHHRRAGFWSPWHAGWINLKVMFVYTPDSFLIKPSILCMVIGLAVMILSLIGSVSIGPLGFDIYMLLLGMTSIILGYSLYQVGIFARKTHKLRNGIEQQIAQYFTYDVGAMLSFVLVLIGLLFDVWFLWKYIENGYRVVGNTKISIIGLLLIILGVQTFSFTLMVELKRRMNIRR